jgi:N-acetylglucosamine kinase-like BadF-type ATPase
MAYFLGIDAGGTKTAALIGDERRELGHAEGPSSKIQNVGESAARAALRDVIQNTCAAAKISPHDLVRICVGFSGASNREVAEVVRLIIHEITPAEVQVVGDNVVALEAAVGGGSGVVVVAGTGSIAYGRSERGEEARAGGFGPVISDEGSGTWIGKRAVRSIAQTAETAGPLAQLVLSAWNCRSIGELVSRANATPAPDFATLFPIVVQASTQRDALACDTLNQAGRQLAHLAKEVIQKLWPGGRQQIRIGQVGGVFKNSAMVRESFSRFLQSLYQHVEVSQNIAEPAVGALSIARHGLAA